MNGFQPIPVRHDVNARTFTEEILIGNRPAVLRGLVRDWPVVRAANESPQALADCIKGFDRGAPTWVVEGPPAIHGRLFYREDMTGFNFERTGAHIGATLDRLLAQASDPAPRAIFIESIPTDDFLPGFAAAHPMPLVEERFRPRIWIGNSITVQTHYDLFDNIACVAGGRRRFTLFPPAQVANLYPGPIDFTPAGAPLSMVPLRDPDLARYPRFAEALRHALQAELEPGDALYIPYGWWHHVESLTPFNVLVNFWWNTAPRLGSPNGALLLAALTVRDLPAAQREVWRSMFEHFVFTDPAQALGHLAPERRGLFGPPSPERSKAVREVLTQALGKP